MKKLSLFLLFGLLMTLFTAGSAALSQEAVPTANDVAVVQAYYDALNAGMIDEAMVFVADDAQFINPTGTYIGKAEIAESLVGLANDAITFELDHFSACEGRVVYAYEVLQNGNPIDAGTDGLTIVQDGLITFDGTLTTETSPYAPERVYQAYLEAINGGDVETAMQFVAEDAVLTDPNGVTSGKEAIHAYLEGILASGITFEMVDIETQGNRIYSTYKVFQNGTQIDAGDDGLAIIENGLIVFDGLMAQAPQPPTDPSGVVEAYYNALNEGNLESAMSFIAADVLFINPIGEFSGTDAVNEHLTGVINDKITFDLNDFRVCDGRVVYAYEVLVDGSSVEVGDGGLTIVQDGKIIFDGTEDTVPEELAGD